MKIYYNKKKAFFFHRDSRYSSLGFGLNKYVIYKPEEKADHSFRLDEDNKNCGPLIGILVSRNPEGNYRGNFSFFKKLQCALQEQGALSFVFTPSDIHHQTIEGLIYHAESNKWLTCTLPFPHFIYNRVPSRTAENSHDHHIFKSFVEENQISYFNPHFFDKWDIYQVLNKSRIIKPLLPFTEKMTSIEKAQLFLEKYKKAYVKPVLSSQGNGIRLIEHRADDKIICRSTTKIEGFSSFDRLIQHYHHWFIEGTHIIQEAIECQTFQNHRYDFRVLSQNVNNEFVVTGIGIRSSERQEVTTHVPQGGKILSLKAVNSKKQMEEIPEIVRICGGLLMNHYGLIGEFSLDLGKRKDGELVLFEVNSKPMKFDEEEIETNRLKRLVEAFLLQAKENQLLY
ncbi:glutathione synthase/RimK-type ligase-like ATP-grasp enzyme [Bacillus pakistanensis]|uniref:Glutathione synthase/RimK-type ligase-like ATP-grasp enzyme n=1 Tax=Rossellomorea pakistanensis TaxID=992288 RepID=A0ABS2NF10_9BACI|nr:YheC/YheD family protein [Bacillus pakistanensis]MBM7586405.1 glutathione synthase/RimK-type ligase-like ATP-grasp enzyme [Bacillus pakistanensis]